MLSGYLNLFGLAFTLAAVAAFVWRARIKKYSPDSQIKDLWLKILFYVGLLVLFMGAALWWDNRIWFRAGLVIGHIFLVPALYYISKAWWKLLVGEMPKWWGWLIIALGVSYVGSEAYFGFFQGWLPYAEIIRGNITVMVRNDHPFVAWLFMPTAWSAFWPMGYVFFRQSFQASEFKLKVRLFVFGLAWIIGSTVSVYSNFVTDPQRILTSNLALVIVFALLIPAAFLKPKQGTATTIGA